MRCELHSARFESRRCDDMADDHGVASTEERQECNNNSNNNHNNNHNNSNQNNHNNHNHNNHNNHNNNNNSRINVRHDTSRTPKFPDVPEVKIAASVNIQRPQKPKKKRRDKSDLGENFVAPDGGWGWLVAIAGGVNILVSFAVAQQFGIIFRNRMVNIGLSSSELTTIINGQISVSSLTGLLNGPVFRRYTYRQVALVGSALTFLGLFLAVFADSFLFYMCTYSCLYGFGRGLTVSASSLAVNTFFKLKRRTATAYQFGVAGLGPIFLPYIATFLLQFFGVQGTVLIFSGISLHTFACSLVYQPVKWHTAQPPREATSLKSPTPRVQLENEDMGHIVEPETPTLSRANDGWFGSRHSLNALSYRSRLSTLEKEKEKENDLQLVDLKRLTINNSFKLRSISISHSIREEQTEIADDPPNDCTKSTELRNKSAAELQQLEREERKKLPLYIKIVIFFDLDLLRDVTYVNLAVGLTLINFVEVNFAILTPFILSDFGFASGQIALAMSILGLCDLVIRFLIPVITASMNFSNKAFFIFGIIGMCVGRAVLSVTRDFYTMLGVFVFMGLNKAFRTVFWSLIIPGHVPLRRLPAAAGLQLLMSGIFSMAFGPLIGLIRDNTNYAFTLNFLNGLCILAIVAWIAEALWRKQQRATPSASAAGP